MHLASRARATLRTQVTRPVRWTMPLVLTGLALSRACTIDPAGGATSSGAAPAGSPSGAGTASSGSTSPSLVPSASSPTPSGSRTSSTTEIRVVVGGRTFVGELDDNATARDLADKFPLSVTMDDLHGTEKTGGLPQALTTNGAPRGADPEVGEIGYYAPGRDLVFYYGDVGYFPGIIRIGRFRESIDRLADEADGFNARIEVQPS